MFCTSCGSKAEDGNAYCGKCGKNFNNPPTVGETGHQDELIRGSSNAAVAPDRVKVGAKVAPMPRKAGFFNRSTLTASALGLITFLFILFTYPLPIPSVGGDAYSDAELALKKSGFNVDAASECENDREVTDVTYEGPLISWYSNGIPHVPLGQTLTLYCDNVEDEVEAAAEQAAAEQAAAEQAAAEQAAAEQAAASQRRFDETRNKIIAVQNCPRAGNEWTPLSFTMYAGVSANSIDDPRNATDTVNCVAGALGLSSLQQQQILNSRGIDPFQSITVGDFTVGWKVNHPMLQITVEWLADTGVTLE